MQDSNTAMHCSVFRRLPLKSTFRRLPTACPNNSVGTNINSKFPKATSFNVGEVLQDFKTAMHCSVVRDVFSRSTFSRLPTAYPNNSAGTLFNLTCIKLTSFNVGEVMQDFNTAMHCSVVRDVLLRLSFSRFPTACPNNSKGTLFKSTPHRATPFNVGDLIHCSVVRDVTLLEITNSLSQ